MAMHKFEHLNKIHYIHLQFLGLDCYLDIPVPKFLIRGGISKGSVRKANLLTCAIQHDVKALKKGKPVDKIKTRPAVATNITHNKINVASNSADQAVKRTRPDLSIGSQFESFLYAYSGR